MLKKVFLALLIPLPVVALALGVVVVMEFQKLQSAGATQLSPLVFAQQKLNAILQPNEARAAVTPEPVSVPALKTAPKAATPQATPKADAVKATQGGDVNTAGALPGDIDAKSFKERFSGLFSSGKEPEIEKPRRMICKMHRGFKRCRFPKEK